MKRLFFLITLLIFFTSFSEAQNVRMFQYSSDPSGACQFANFALNTTTGKIFYCSLNSWTALNSSTPSFTSVTTSLIKNTIAGTSEFINLDGTLHNIRFNTSNSLRTVIDGTGIGINVASFPSVALDVVGAGSISTSLTTPSYICGTSVSQTCTFKTTTANGTGDSYIFTGGNNGATTFATLGSGGYTSSTSIILGTTPATTGIIRIPKASYLMARNNANNDDIPLIGMNSGGFNRVTIGKAAYPSEFPSGDASVPGVTGQSFTTTGLYWAAGPILGITVNGSSVGTFSATTFGLVTSLTLNTGTTTGTALTANGTGYWSGLTAESGTKSTLCIDPATFQILTNAAATCTVSNLESKSAIHSINSREAIDIVKSMKPWVFKDKDGKDSERFGFAAEWTDSVDKRLVYYDKNKPHAIDYERYTAVLTTVIQEILKKVK